MDFLTPNDTHVYAISQPMFNRNLGETAVDPGGDTTINLFNPQPSLGFIVITPVVSDVDLTAISFQNLIGNYEGTNNSWFNIMGRDALDFATGQVVPDGTPLDGVTNGFVGFATI